MNCIAQLAFRLPSAILASCTATNRLRRSGIAAAALFVLAAFCVSMPALRAQAPASTPGDTSVHGISIANMNPAIKPGDDFYTYANGAWVDRTQIPPDRAAVEAFTLLADLSRQRINAIISELAKSNPAAGSDARKIADLYKAVMDQAAINARGIDPIKPRLAEIAAISDRRQLSLALGKTLRADVDLLNNSVLATSNLLGLWVAPGFSDSSHYMPYLLQGGLEMPNRDYYLTDSESMRKIRSRFATHIAAMFRLAGMSDADGRAARVIALEHSIAAVQISVSDIEDIAKANNLWKRNDFAAKAPGLDWDAYFEGAGFPDQQEFMVWTPTALTGEAALISTTPVETWKDWLAYHYIEDHAALLPDALADESFNFFGKTLAGVEQQRPRSQRATDLVNNTLGDAVGQIYVQKYFSPKAKAQAEALVTNLIAAYDKRLAALPWLSPSTRAEAQAKLRTLYIGIGYPETWLNYAAYEVRPDDAFGNATRFGIWNLRREIARIGKPVNRQEWCMTPQTVNAVNLPLQNALNFPAAILQPPFFDPDRPAVDNYGAIGSIIGHEISHTFDEEGSDFDSKGRVRNWWTADDRAHFDQAAINLEKQYDAYGPFPGVKVNGKQTVNENIADLGGIAAAYEAYRASSHGAEAPAQNGFTGDQQFFIAFAQNWCSKFREAVLRNQVLTDPHAPAQFRADISRNSDAWYKAFNVQPGEKLYLAPSERIRIW